MAVDLSVFSRQKTLLDQQQLQAAFEQKKALAALQSAALIKQITAPAVDPFEVMKFQEAARHNRAQEELSSKRLSGGEPYVDPDTGEIVNPSRKLSPTEQKIFDTTTDAVNSAGNAKSSLSEALTKLSGGVSGKDPVPFSGAGAETLAGLNNYPVVGMFVDDKRATATTDYSNLVTQQALSNLKATFGGNPTEGERKILLDLQALPKYNPDAQKAIIGNAIKLADSHIKQGANKLNTITTGNYAGAAKTLANTPQNVAPEGFKIQDAQGNILIKQGGKFVPISN